ncbi:type IV pilus assembly protein PilM [bacterium]|nr:type IV pilus assembly protein PilM [FCB group bacterium]MBL7191475.1 type IV pilus assembly protein PilM [bacterium]
MFGRSNQRVGLDIGSHSIKLVVMDKAGSKMRLTKIAVQPIYGTTEKYDIDGPKRSVVVPALSEAFKKINIQPRKVRNLFSSISAAQVSAKEIITIKLDDEEMASAMLLEARKHLPLDGSHTVVDYQVLGDDPKDPDKVRALLAATTQKLYDAHQEILRDLELKLGVVDIDQLAAVNSYIINNELPDEGVIVFLNIGCRKTNLTVFGRQDMFFTRDINIAGHAFTEELIKKFGIDYTLAEKVKIEQGLHPDLEKLGVEDTASIKVAEKSAIDKFGDEINRSLRYYVKETGQSLFNRIIMTGGSAALKGLDESLHNKFNIPVEMYNPISVYGEQSDGHYGPQFAVAFGLALRGE